MCGPTGGGLSNGWLGLILFWQLLELESKHKKQNAAAREAEAVELLRLAELCRWLSWAARLRGGEG